VEFVIYRYPNSEQRRRPTSGIAASEPVIGRLGRSGSVSVSGRRLGSAQGGMDQY
jgi:hypothetical protein